MNPKQLGLTEYNDIMLSVYDANPVANISESLTKTEELAKPEPEEKKPKKVGSNLLRKETYKLKLAAVANLKLTKRIFAYEKRRLKQLTVDFGKIQKTAADSKDKKDKKKKKKEKDEKKSIRGWFGRALRDLAKKLRKSISDAIKKFLRKRYIKNYKKLSPDQRKNVRDRKKFFDKQKRKYNRFKQRGGFGGVLRRRLGRAGTRLIGKRNAARIRLFRQTGGVRGAVRRQFFGGLRSAKTAVKGALSTARQIKDIIGIGIQTAKGPGARPAVNAATKAGRGIIAQTARNAFVGALGKGGSKQVLKIVKNYISPVIKRIPVIGTLIDFALNFFVFKEPLGKAAFKAIGAGLMAWLGGAIGSIVPVAGTAVGAALGGWAGDALSGLLYDAMFGGGSSEGGEKPDASKLELNQFSEGGKVPAKPQLVMVGEGGEEEYIIPKSKLAYFLGSDEAFDFVNAGASKIISGVHSYLSDTGLIGKAMGAIPEFSKVKGIAKGKIKSGFRAIRESSASEVFSRILKFIEESLTKVKDMFMDIFEKVKSFIPDLSGLNPWLKNQLRWIAKVAGGPLVTLVDVMLGGSAQAATRPPQGPLNDDLDLPLPTPVDGSPFINPTPKTNLKKQKGGYSADTGLDIHGNIGDPIVAPASGTLEYAEAGHTAQADQDSDPNTPGFQPQYSFRIKLDSPFTYQGKTVRFIYGTHLSSLDPSVANKTGIRIQQGQRLGAMGQANGVPHLHLGLVGDRQQSEFLNFQQVDALLGGRYAKEQNKPEKTSSVSNAIKTLGGDPTKELEVPTIKPTGRRASSSPPLTMDIAMAPLNIKDTSSNLENLEDTYQEEMLVAMEPQVIIRTQYVPIPISMGGSLGDSGVYQRSSSWLPGVLGA